MKLWVKTIIIVFAFIVLAVLAFAVKRWIDMNTLDKGGMVRDVSIERVDFKSSGGMRGGHTYISAVRDAETDEITVEVNHQEIWNSPEEITEYKAKLELFDDISAFVEESCFWKAEKRPLSKDIVLDGPNEELRIKTRDGLDFTVENDRELAKAEYEAWYAIIKALRDENYKAE